MSQTEVQLIKNDVVVNADINSSAAIAGSKVAPDFGSQNVATTGTISDSKGDVRKIPQLSKSSAHTIISSDAGKHSINSSGGWVFNTSTGFSVGDVITLINNSGSNQTIDFSAVSAYNTADGATGNRTLAGRGMATAICTAANTYYISGAGLS